MRSLRALSALVSHANPVLLPRVSRGLASPAGAIISIGVSQPVSRILLSISYLLSRFSSVLALLIKESNNYY